jgi:Pyruvate/2-oxoacid:ferredoxin oxidoreductase delta subunit
MKPGFFNHEHIRTPYIQLDTKKCKACWKCITDCPNQVIGKVDLPWHKHAVILKSDSCTGCLKCIHDCPFEAYMQFDKAKPETETQWKRIFNRFLLNNLLLISCIVMIVSGLILQLGFHAGGSGGHHTGSHGVLSQSMQYEQIRMIDLNKIVFALTYRDWSTTHKIAIVFFSMFLIWHINDHWKWYKRVFTKHLIRKNIQVKLLSVLFILVAVTGLIPWLIDLSDSSSGLRLVFIEIHDKLALVLVIYLILHICKRIKWFVNTYANIKKQAL